MITIKRVDSNSFQECIGLTVHKEQERYVRSNLYSLAEAYISKQDNICEPLTVSIYDEDKMVGFTLIYYHGKDIRDSTLGKYYEIRRFMIGEAFQGCGYGKIAFGEIISYLRTLPIGEAKTIVLDYMPGNDRASHIYHSYGFIDTDEYNKYGEIRSVVKL